MKTVAAYTFPAVTRTGETLPARPLCDWHPDGCPDADPGRAFFVSVVSGAHWRALTGPYDTHLDALAKVAEAEGLAQRDPRASFYAYGTVQAPSDTRTIFGRL